MINVGDFFMKTMLLNCINTFLINVKTFYVYFYWFITEFPYIDILSRFISNLIDE